MKYEEDEEYEKYLEKPWLKSQAMAGIPETLQPYPEDLTYPEDILGESVKKYPNELALVQFDYEMTYKELKEHVDRFATALADMNVKKGDIIMSVLPSSIQFIIADLAIAKIGAIHAPAYVVDPVDVLVYKATLVNCKIVICIHTNMMERDIVDKVKEARERAGFETIILSKIEDYSKNPSVHDEEDVLWMTDLIEKYPPNPPKIEIEPKKDLCLLLFTGGTTGRSKASMLTHYSLVARNRLSLGAMAPQSLTPLAHLLTTIIVFPIASAAGHEFFEMLLSNGSTVMLLPDPRDTKEFIRLAKKYHPIFMPASPTSYGQLAKEGANLGILGISGAMPLSKKIRSNFQEKTGSIVFNAMGLSEFCGAAVIPTIADILAPLLGGRETACKIIRLLDKIMKIPAVVPLVNLLTALIGRQNVGAIANMAIPLVSSVMPSMADKDKESIPTIGYPMVDTDLKVVDTDTGEKILISKFIKEKLRGEMCLNGAHRMLGYFPTPGSGIDEEGYVHTGDVVMLDEEGKIYIVDRTKDMINVSGYKVYSVEVDEILYTYPGVYEAATIGIPDPDRPGSEIIKCFVSPSPGYKERLKENDIIEFLKGKLPKYAVPKSIEIKDELPQTGPGEKIFKRKLREEEIEKMKREGLL